MNKLKTTIFTTLIFTCCTFNVNAQDIDNDGVPDLTDNCNFTFNPTQADNDGDQIGDFCDCNSSDANPLGQHIPAILITATPSTTINTGDLVSFNSIIDAGGTSPFYQWKKNSVNVGVNSPTYSDNTLINGDVITCELTSDVVCLAGNIKNSNSLTFIVNTLSTIENNFYDYKIILYPNPATNEIFIKSNFNIDYVEITDLNGREIKTLKIQNNKIDIQYLNSGIYFLKININGNFISEKIVKN